jgi:uncharacterized protein
MTDLVPHILLTTGTFILAGLDKGVTGLGWLRARVRPEIFRLGFFAGLLVLGDELLLRGLT